MKLGRLNHIGVATPSIAESLRYYRDVMGATIAHEPFDLEEQGVTVCFVDTPGEDGTHGTQIELIEPLGEQSTLTGFLPRTPPGGNTMSATKSRTSRTRVSGLRTWVSGSSAPRVTARMARRSSSCTLRT